MSQMLQTTLSVNGHIVEFVNPVSFHASASTRLKIPVCVIEVSDTTSFFKRNPLLGDGAVFTITLKGEQGTLVVYDFQYVSHTEKNLTSHTAYVIETILLAPTYWLDSTSYPYYYEGSSHDAINFLAADQGKLNFTGDITQDSQVWHFGGKTICNAIYDIALGAYAGDNSTMVVCCDINKGGTIRLLNVDSIREPIWTLYHNEYRQGRGNVSVIGPISRKSSPGSNNSSFSYNNTQLGASPNSTEVIRNGTDHVTTIHTKISATKTEPGNINVSARLSSVTQNPKFTPMGVDIGNNHDNYQRAVYQNRRGVALYNTSIEVHSKTVTDIAVLDSVNLVTDERAFAGLWYVSSRGIRLVDGDYTEILELVRRTTDAITAPPDQASPAPDTRSTDLSYNPKYSIPSITEWLGADLPGLATGLLGAVGVAVATKALGGTNPADIAKNYVDQATAVVDSLKLQIDTIADEAITSIHAIDPDAPPSPPDSAPLPTRESVAAIALPKIDTIVTDSESELSDWKLKIGSANSAQVVANAVNLNTVTKLAGAFTSLSGAKDNVVSAFSGKSSVSGIKDAVKSAKSTYNDTSKNLKDEAAANQKGTSSYDPVAEVADYATLRKDEINAAVDDGIYTPPN